MTFDLRRWWWWRLRVDLKTLRHPLMRRMEHGRRRVHYGWLMGWRHSWGRAVEERHERRRVGVEGEGRRVGVEPEGRSHSSTPAVRWWNRRRTTVKGGAGAGASWTVVIPAIGSVIHP